MKISLFFDRIINFLKWPAAVYMLFCVPALLTSFRYFQPTNIKTIALFSGLVFFVFSKTMMDTSVKTSMQVIAHELTHAFFALITFHKVKNIRLNPDDTGGEMGFVGNGNWLIIVAPYFFPIFVFVFVVMTFFLKQNIIFSAVLGYLLGYHLDTVASQIHDKQTDLTKVGYKFCFMFLPGANLWVIGLILAYNARGLNGFVNYIDFVNTLNISLFNDTVRLLNNLF